MPVNELNRLPSDPDREFAEKPLFESGPCESENDGYLRTKVYIAAAGLVRSFGFVHLDRRFETAEELYGYVAGASKHATSGSFVDSSNNRPTVLAASQMRVCFEHVGRGRTELLGNYVFADDPGPKLVTLQGYVHYPPKLRNHNLVRSASAILDEREDVVEHTVKGYASVLYLPHEAGTLAQAGHSHKAIQVPVKNDYETFGLPVTIGLLGKDQVIDLRTFANAVT
jgi:hypothetical protein